jgi:hypothetical protein
MNILGSFERKSSMTQQGIGFDHNDPDRQPVLHSVANSPINMVKLPPPTNPTHW